MGAQTDHKERYISLLIGVGWVCLLASSICMLFMARGVVGGEQAANSLSLMLGARLSGMSAFVIGVVSIINERWTSGALLLILSMVLPIISVLVVGSI